MEFSSLSILLCSHFEKTNFKPSCSYNLVQQVFTLFSLIKPFLNYEYAISFLQSLICHHNRHLCCHVCFSLKALRDLSIDNERLEIPVFLVVKNTDVIFAYSVKKQLLVEACLVLLRIPFTLARYNYILRLVNSIDRHPLCCPEALIVLVSTKNSDLWVGPTQEDFLSNPTNLIG